MGLFNTARQADVACHPADEIMLHGMEQRGQLGQEIRWVHHLFFRDEATAMEAAHRVDAAGWSIDWLDAQPEPFVGWVLRAGRNEAIDRTDVVEARAFFERLAADTQGKYDGWDIRPVPKHAKRALRPAAAE